MRQSLVRYRYIISQSFLYNIDLLVDLVVDLKIAFRMYV